MTGSAPLVTVLLPIYNAGIHLRESIESVLRQTCGDFELLMINDASTDDSARTAKTYCTADPRLRLFENPKNLGLIGTLNRGLEEARGTYIARMDQDDISEPTRLEEQVRLLEARPEIGLCGTWYRLIGKREGVLIQHPVEHKNIRETFLHTGNVMGHTTVMMRASVLKETGYRYDPEFKHAEDFELWSRLLQKTKLHNLPKFLLRYRTHAGQTSVLHSPMQFLNAARVQVRFLREAYPDLSPPQELWLAKILALQNERAAAPDARDLRKLLRAIYKSNARNKAFSRRGMAKALRQIWYNFFRNNLDVWGWKAALRFALGPAYFPLQPHSAIRKTIGLLIRSSLGERKIS